jgi:Ser/Thr protein kinase RdoA (MazF antagonist)
VLPDALVEPAALVPMLADAYRLTGPITCTWIRRGFNDHYLVETAAGMWVLRLYFNHKYWISGPEDFVYELELLRFVHARGVSVAAPVERRDGGLLGTVETEAGARNCALFEFAEGSIHGALTAVHGRLMARTLSEFHVAADEFRPSRPAYGRYDLDLRYLLDQPMELVDRFLVEHGRQGLERFGEAVMKLRDQVLSLPRDSGVYGPIRGDPHRGNVAVTRDGRVTLFDFDHGGFGWRAYDLAVATWRGARGGWAPRIEAYESVRPLSDAERRVLPVFRKLNGVWDLGDVLAMQAAWGVDREIGEEFAKHAETRLERLLR